MTQLFYMALCSHCNAMSHQVKLKFERISQNIGKMLKEDQKIGF